MARDKEIAAQKMREKQAAGRFDEGTGRELLQNADLAAC